MKNILKQFGVWVTSLRQNDFQRATLKLTAYYTAGIFLILLVSSIAVFTAFSTKSTLSPEIVVSLHKSGVSFTEEDLANEFREHLRNILLVVDPIVLILASVASYFFAAETLRPIEDTYRAQQRFMGDVAHELRTPLSVLKSGAENILRHDRAPDEYKEFVLESVEEVDRMKGLSDDLLFLLKNNNGREVVKGKVDLASLAAKQVTRFQAYAQEREVNLDNNTSDAVYVMGAQDDLTRLVQNLLKNAIDYNKAGGSVHVKVETKHNTVVLSVEDSGIGIAKKDLPKIFERFYKTDRSRTQESGASTGLGLSIVREIAVEHGATVSVKSTEGKCTTIAVAFPCVT
jgi:signal transduction histidine kinase